MVCHTHRDKHAFTLLSNSSFVVQILFAFEFFLSNCKADIQTAKPLCNFSASEILYLYSIRIANVKPFYNVMQIRAMANLAATEQI
jgi:hypothetical protein